MKKYTYQEIRDADPPHGRVEHGEVEVTESPAGDSEAGQFGVIYQDNFLTLVRDPVTFPNYTMGGHLRVLEGDPTRRKVAVVLLAIRPDGQDSFDFAMVRQFRHAVNGWATELPRGLIAAGETPTQGALRELREETGLREPDLMVSLGEMANNSGISGTIGCYYAAVYLGHQRLIQREKNDNEPISNVIWVPRADWRKAIAVPGTPGRPVAPADLFTMGAFGLAEMTGYLTGLQKTWKRMYAGKHLEDARIEAALKHRLERGDEKADVIARCSSPAYAKHFARELAALAPTVSAEDSAHIVIRGITPLGICWLLSTSAVESIGLES